MSERTKWILLGFSLALWAYLPWSEWYISNAPLLHGMVDGKYTLLESEQVRIAKFLLVFSVVMAVSILAAVLPFRLKSKGILLK